MNIFKKTILLLVLVCFFAAALSFAGQPEVFSVQVLKGSVRQSPTFLGKILFELDYGDKVKIVEENASWVNIAAIDFANKWPPCILFSAASIMPSFHVHQY